MSVDGVVACIKLIQCNAVLCPAIMRQSHLVESLGGSLYRHGTHTYVLIKFQLICWHQLAKYCHRSSGEALHAASAHYGILAGVHHWLWSGGLSVISCECCTLRM